MISFSLIIPTAKIINTKVYNKTQQIITMYNVYAAKSCHQKLKRYLKTILTSIHFKIKKIT